MNRWFAGLAVLGVAVAGALLFLLQAPPTPALPETKPPTNVAAPASNSAAVLPARGKPVSTPAAPIASVESVPVTAAATPAPHMTPTGGSKTAPGGLPAPDPDPSGLPPATVLENTRSVFRAFAARFGGNPVGTNPEITAALNGGNPKQVNFLKTEDGLRINARGELIDSWGTPYFFHQLAGVEMEIHSAGPDLRMWTADDLVIK